MSLMSKGLGALGRIDDAAIASGSGAWRGLKASPSWLNRNVLQAGVPEGAGKFKRYGTAAGRLGGLAGVGVSAFADNEDTWSWGDAATGALSGAATGFRVGKGPWGAIVGAGLGGLVGGFSPLGGDGSDADAGQGTFFPWSSTSGASAPSAREAIPGYRPGQVSLSPQVERLLATASTQRASAMADLESTYQSQLANIGNSYQLSETPQEKAALAQLLGDLRAQRAHAEQVIDTQYAAAIDGTAAQVEESSKTADRSVKQTERLYKRAAREDARTAEATASMTLGGNAAQLGLAAAGAGQDANTAEQATETRREGARAASATRQINDLHVNALKEMQASLTAQEGAQHGQVQRVTQGLMSDARASHSAQVNQRIAAERLARAAAEAQLGATYMGQRGQLQSEVANDALGRAQLLTGIDQFNATARGQAAADVWNRRTDYRTTQLAQRLAGGSVNVAETLQQAATGDLDKGGTPASSVLASWLAAREAAAGMSPGAQAGAMAQWAANNTQSVKTYNELAVKQGKPQIPLDMNGMLG